jgi:asparagine synthase (glutamine-hydrolysing)
MCGIWALITDGEKDGKYYFDKVKRRGPERSYFKKDRDRYIGFHRLSIMDPSTLGDQPFILDEIKLICNGEIYNFKHLKDEYKLDTKSDSDCEVILHLYRKFGINKTLELLDGVFAFIIFDNDKIIVARDRIGVRPLFYSYNLENGYEYGFSSIVSGLAHLTKSNVNVFTPGTYMTLTKTDKGYKREDTVYYNYIYQTLISDEQEALEHICSVFTRAVEKRLISDRPICCLLSGGLDSSLVCAIASKYLKTKGETLKTFSIGMKGATDIGYAEKVAEYIGSEHTTVYFNKQEGLKAIQEVIRATESYDITTIRASVGQYLISKYISEKTDIKVVFNGDGSDELCMGYMYFHNAPTPNDAQSETVRLIQDIHLYDGLRSDRCVSYHGLEPRTPFLDCDFVELIMSIDPKLKVPKDNAEKYLLRKAFKGDLLPDEILWRKKEAFSDGVSSEKESWFETIQKYMDKIITDEDLQEGRAKYDSDDSEIVNETVGGRKVLCQKNVPKTKEALYYREIFNILVEKRNSNVIPYFWLPKWCGDIEEPSARVLNVYNKDTSKKIETV